MSGYCLAVSLCKRLVIPFADSMTLMCFNLSPLDINIRNFSNTEKQRSVGTALLDEQTVWQSSINGGPKIIDCFPNSLL